MNVRRVKLRQDQTVDVCNALRPDDVLFLSLSHRASLCQCFTAS